MEEPKIYFAKTKESAIIPSKERENAGYDIYACWEGIAKRDKILKPHTTKLIPTGISCALPIDYYFQVEERGRTGSKGIKKGAGVVDSGYRGEIFVAITNANDNYLIFGDKDGYLEEALHELEVYQNIDVNNLSDVDKENAIQLAKSLYTEDVFDNYFNDEQREKAMIDCLKQMQDPMQREMVIANIHNSIFYPENKAIAQLILHKVDDLPVEEISYEELSKIPSNRGTGKLGSSNK